MSLASLKAEAPMTDKSVCSASELPKWTIELLTLQGTHERSIMQSMQQIPESVVDAVCSSEATSAELKSVRELAQLDVARMDTLLSCFQRWSEVKLTGSASLWALLAKHDMKYRNLMTLLFAYVKTEQEQALAAANLYLSLLQVPGNFNMFNPIVLRQCLNLVKAWARVHNRNALLRQKKGKKPVAAKAAVQGTRKQPSRKQQAAAMDVSGDGEEGNSENPFEKEDGASEEARRLASAWLEAEPATVRVMSCLGATYGMLQTASLKSFSEAFTHVVETLVDVTRTRLGKAEHEPSQQAYACLGQLLLPLHGSPKKALNVVLKHLLPNVLMSWAGVLGSSVPPRQQAVRAEAMRFAMNTALGQRDLWSGVLYFMQHICVRCPDKAEPRRQVVTALADMLCALPALFKPLAKFLFSLSRSSKAAYRIMSVELASLLLTREELVHDKAGGLALPFVADRSQPPTPIKEAMAVDEEEGEDGLAAAAAAADADNKAAAEAADLDQAARQMLSLLLSRCNDKTASVRAKALLSLATSVQGATENPSLRDHFAHLLSQPQQAAAAMGPPQTKGTMPNTPGGHNTTSSLSSLSTLATPHVSKANWSLSMLATPQLTTPARSNNSSSNDAAATNAPISAEVTIRAKGSPFHPRNRGIRDVLTILHRRAADARPVVRKAAIQAMEAILKAAQQGDQDQDDSGPSLSLLQSLTADDLQVFFDGCMDSSLSIRKQSLDSLSRMLERTPRDPTLQKVWLGAVLPLIADAESTVQDKCMDWLDELVLQRLIKQKGAQADIVWDMLAHSNAEIERFLQRAVAIMFKRQRFPVKVVSYLNKLVKEGAKTKGVWVLLEVVSTHAASKVDAAAVAQAWGKVAQRKSADAQLFSVRVLRVLANVASHLPATSLTALDAQLVEMLGQLQGTCSPSVLSAQIQALRAVCGALKEQGQPARSWEAELLKSCQSALEAFVLGRGNARSHDPEQLVRYLFTAGEVVLGCEAKAPSPLVTLVQSLLPKRLPANTSSLSQLGNGGDSNSSSSSNNNSVNQSLELPAMVRAHAFVAMGKLCMRDETLAKRAITVLVRELETGDDAVIRNNVLVVLCDLCRTFTSVVDNYIPSLTGCLRDSNAVVRQHTIMIMSQLLQEDFLKWKGAMFFRYLSSVNDSDSAVRALGEQSLTAILQQKAAKSKFHSHFVEAVFYANGCKAHPTFNQFPTDESKFAVPGSGPRARARRFAMYNYLLSHMADEHKFHTTAKLCQDVLGAVVERKMPMTAQTEGVVRDALAILASNQIKLQALRGNRADNEEVEPEVEVGGAAAAAHHGAVQAARGKFLSKLVKKNTMENIVPILIELKRVLEKNKSPLLRDLLMYLKELLKDYSSELDDILTADRQLAAELRYDLAQFQKQQEAQKQEEALLRLAQTPLGAALEKSVGASPCFTPSRRRQSGSGKKRTSTGRKSAPGSAAAAAAAAARGTPMSTPARSRGATPRSGRKEGMPPPPVFGTPRLRKTVSDGAIVGINPGSVSASDVRLPRSTPRRKRAEQQKDEDSPRTAANKALANDENAAPVDDKKKRRRQSGADVFLKSPLAPSGPAKTWNVDLAGDTPVKTLNDSLSEVSLEKPGDAATAAKEAAGGNKRKAESPIQV